MQFAINRESPSPKRVSVCGLCDKKVIAKCGRVKIWHWAHESNEDCDNWYEPMSEWHMGWQACVPVEMREIYMSEGREKHRADIRLPNGLVVEIQRSNLDEDTVIEREDFYKNMVWIFDGTNLFNKMSRYDKTSKDGNAYVSWYYNYRPKHWVADLQKTVYIDFGEQILRINQDMDEGVYFKMEETEYYDEWSQSTKMRKKYSGWGKHLTREEAKKEIFGQYYEPVDPQFKIDV